MRKISYTPLNHLFWYHLKKAHRCINYICHEVYLYYDVNIVWNDKMCWYSFHVFLNSLNLKFCFHPFVPIPDPFWSDFVIKSSIHSHLHYNQFSCFWNSMSFNYLLAFFKRGCRILSLCVPLVIDWLICLFMNAVVHVGFDSFHITHTHNP